MCVECTLCNCDEPPRPDWECWQVWAVHGLLPVPAAAGRLPRHPRHRVERRQLGPREGGDIMANVRFILLTSWPYFRVKLSCVFLLFA